MFSHLCPFALLKFVCLYVAILLGWRMSHYKSFTSYVFLRLKQNTATAIPKSEISIV